MASMPKWLKLVEHKRWNGVTVQVRWWHPSFWRYCARELRQGANVSLNVFGRTFVLPRWFAAEVGAMYVVWSTAFRKVER